MATNNPGRVPRWLPWGLVVSLLLIPVAILVAQSGNPAAPAVTMLLCSIPEMLGGLWLIGGTLRHRDNRGATGRLLLGTALTVLGLGRTLLGIEMALGEPRFPDPFYGLAHLSTAFAALGVMLLPRAQVEPLRGLRTVAEGLVLASV